MEPGSVSSTISPTVNSYRPVPSRKSLSLHFTVPPLLGSIPLPSRPVDKTCSYHPVPSTKLAPTVPSRRQNLPLPSRPVVKTCPYCSVPPSKPVRTVKSRRQTCPYRPAPPFIAVTPFRQDAVNTMNSYYSISVLIPNTYFICPSKDVRRRQSRPVTDGRLDVLINNFPLLRMLHESGIIFCFQSSLDTYIFY